MSRIRSSNPQVNLPAGTSNQGNDDRPATTSFGRNLCQPLADILEHSPNFCAGLEHIRHAAMHVAERGFCRITSKPQDETKLQEFSTQMQALYADLSEKIFLDPNYKNVTNSDDGTFKTPKKSMPYFQSLLLAFHPFTQTHFQSQAHVEGSIQKLTTNLDLVIEAAHTAVAANTIKQKRVEQLNILRTSILKDIQYYHPYPTTAPV